MTGPGVAYRTVFLLDYLYFKKYCKMIAIDLSKNLNLWSNVTVNFNDETNYSDKFWSIDRPVLRLRKAFANNPLANIKSSKSQLSKMAQLGGFLGY